MNKNFNVYEEKEIEELAECGIFEELRKEQEEEASLGRYRRYV